MRAFRMDVNGGPIEWVVAESAAIACDFYQKHLNEVCGKGERFSYMEVVRGRLHEGRNRADAGCVIGMVIGFCL